MFRCAGRFAVLVMLLLPEGWRSWGAEARFSYRRSYAAAPATSKARAVGLRAADRNSPATAPRWLSEDEAQVLVGAPITRFDRPRNFGPVDLGGGGTVVGNAQQPAIDEMPSDGAAPAFAPPDADDEASRLPPTDQARVDTTLYRAYYNPSFVGYRSYASYAGFGYGGMPYGWTNYPPWLYRPRYFYPYRYYPLRTGFSVYNPYFYYNNTYYGRYANPFWSGYGGFAFPYHFGGLAAGGYGGGFASSDLRQYRPSAAGSSAFVPPYSFGGFGYPYRYGAFGYPVLGLYRSVYNYLPTYAYFLYPGLGGLYVPPGFVGFPGYYGYSGYGLPLGSLDYRGGFYW